MTTACHDLGGQFWISSTHFREEPFSGGDVVVPPQSGVLLIVGPNNVGKSTALRDIAALFTNPPQPTAPAQVVTNIGVAKEGSEEELEAWLDEHSRRRDASATHPTRTYTKAGIGRIGWDGLRQSWASAPPLGQAAGFFHQFFGPVDRSGLLGSVSLWDMLSDEPSHPVQLMYESIELEQTVRQLSLEAFAQPVFVNRYAGSTIHLQLGEPPEPTPPPAPVELVRELSTRPHVHQQGDGIRSFLGILVTVLVGDQPLLLIDEPEAFLHPPQAKLLGKKLAMAAPSGKQVIAATHSSDVVVGALEAPDTAVTVVRITREDGVNRAAVLGHEQLRDLWADPLLKYSNVLDGLFHRGVVVCEGDADSLFYSAAVEHWLESRNLPTGDLLFTFSGGKSRLFQISAALRVVGVPVVLVADIDMLRDANELNAALTSLGADPSTTAELQKRVARGVASRGLNPRKEYVEDQLKEVLDACPGGEPIPDRDLDRMKRLLRTTSPWGPLKDAGLAVLAGETHAWARELIDVCERSGLVVLPTGELEAFDREISGHGPEWVAAALERRVHTGAPAQELAERVLGAFNR